MEGYARKVEGKGARGGNLTAEHMRTRSAKRWAGKHGSAVGCAPHPRPAFSTLSTTFTSFACFISPPLLLLSLPTQLFLVATVSPEAHVEPLHCMSGSCRGVAAVPRASCVCDKHRMSLPSAASSSSYTRSRVHWTRGPQSPLSYLFHSLLSRAPPDDTG